jgi:hypothetical protein
MVFDWPFGGKMWKIRGNNAKENAEIAEKWHREEANG